MRRGRASGALAPLHARALALRLGRNAAVLVVLDLMAVSHDWAEGVAAELARACKIPRRNVILAATHTHAAPPLGREPYWFSSAPVSSAEKRFALQAARMAVAAGSSAWRNLQPVNARYGEARTQGIATTRGLAGRKRAAGDLRAGVLRLDSDRGSVAWLCHFACHPTVLGPRNLRYSPDLFGAAAAELERQIPAALFLNGACADVSTRFTRRNRRPAEVRRLGRQLAQALRRAAKAARIISPCELGTRTAEVKLPVGPGAAPRDGFTARAVAHLAGWRRRESCRLVTLHLPPWALVAIPGELPHATGRAISGRTAVWPVCYANDYLGYFAAGTSPEYEDVLSAYPRSADLIARLARWLTTFSKS